jgi:hypothetical protein
VGDQGGDLGVMTEILVILDSWRVGAIYRSYRLSRYVTESTFSDQGTAILTEHMPRGNHVHCRDEIGGDEHFPR